ncbi:MAG: rod shape-determining protein MreD [Armatimonadota bacterium]|nr:MAG: rod shape-determining protein MreD [Armatimonadota bacterium]
MARRAIFTAAVIALCGALQFSVLHWARIAGVEPDLLLIVTVVIGLLSGPRAGMAVGFSAGVVQGAVLGRGIGVFAAAKTIVGYLVGVAGARLYVENLFVMMGAAAAMTVAHEVIALVLTRSQGVSLGNAVVSIMLQACYNGGAALIVGAALRRVRPLLPQQEVRG